MRLLSVFEEAFGAATFRLDEEFHGPILRY
jgi:hypothetical protein